MCLFNSGLNFRFKHFSFFHSRLFIRFLSIFHINNTQFVKYFQCDFQKRPKLLDIFLNSVYVLRRILRRDAKLLHVMANFCHLGFSYSLLFFQIQKRFLPFQFLFIILVFGLFGSRNILTASFFYAGRIHLERQNQK